VVKKIDPLEDSRWDAFVHSHPYGSAYQSSAWLKVIASSYHQARPTAFIRESPSSDILAALPYCSVASNITGKRLVSLPFSSFSDPLTSTADEFCCLFDAIADEMHHPSYKYFELRQFRNSLASHDQRLVNCRSQKIHVLDINPGFDRIKRSFHRDCIVRSVRKAEKAGLVVEEGRSEKDLKAFYQVHAVTRRRLGLPVQPYAFFSNMRTIMSGNGYFTLLLCKHEKKIIAGIILFKYKDTVSFEHGASFPKYLPMRPNHLLMWRSLELACAAGYRYFDFGKTDKENIGLLDYKSRWGAATFDVSYLYYPNNRSLLTDQSQSGVHKLAKLVAKKVPMPVAKLIGRIAYKHLG
jgi:lipid II:glycine glycyltransferase (peptidoglycan interpeptide bridge formation enzyme)